jgi:putative FmdB family regulatory protein
MPTYVYRCRDCQQDTEVVQRFNEAPLTRCPHCGGPLQRLLFPPAIIFKGSGWYATDHKSPSGGNGSKVGTTTASTSTAATAPAKSDESSVTKKTSDSDEV